MVWIVPEGNAQSLRFHAISDSAIVSGLIFLALRVTSAWPATSRPPAATAWRRCWPSSARPRRPSCSAIRRERTCHRRRHRAGAAVPARFRQAAGIPHLRDAVLPGGRGHRRLAHLRSHPQSVLAGPGRPGRGTAVLLCGAVRRLPGRPSAAAPAGHGRLLRADRHRAGADQRGQGLAAL
ncbi:hypothetical protein G6F35_016470 [Rhizopus arrhizus]|uniref:Uncharacterized protein n=1 Tax=Rhizopus delemar TaxID=936053 RepID=A0A9P7C5E5_9FUNG|nr:hypothetical protein G6F35_016470 [Rhizopus arrhizus]KAG1536543.1 hypothetical protein G6F50_015036 [Rhizopus delemar]